MHAQRIPVLTKGLPLRGHFTFLRKLSALRRCIHTRNTEDYDASNVSRKEWLQYYNRPQDISPEYTSILLFPGQGSQFPGMGKGLIHLSKVKAMFQCVSEMLRTDLLETCLNGPEYKLNQTLHCQVAIYTVSLAAVVKLEEEENELIKKCVATAGFSVGEITSLVFAGAMTFEQGLHVVRCRAESMQRACDQTPGAMASVFIDHDSQLKLALAAAINHCETQLKIGDPQCQIANYLYSDCKVVSGHTQAIDFLEENAAKFRIRRVKRLPVSGAFHTSLMKSAMGPVRRALEKIDGIKVPGIPVISSVDNRPYSSVQHIIRKLPLQLVRPLCWEQTMHALYARPPDTPFPTTVELGPGRQLGSILRMVNRKGFAFYKNVEV